MMRRTTFPRVAAAALAAALTLAPAPRAAFAVMINRIVATIDGDPITLYEMKEFVRQRSAGHGPAGFDFDPAPVLDGYILQKIIEKEIQEQGIVIREADIERYIDTIRKRNQLTEEGLRQAVQAQGLTWDEYRSQVRSEIEKAQLINREIRGKVNITPEDVERYYEAHKEDYATPGELHLRHIVLLLPREAPEDKVREVMGRAYEIHQRLVDGDDFEDLAREFSQDAAAEEGGDLGFVKRGQIFEEIEQAADKLKVGEVSRPIRTDVGVHIVEVVEKRGASYTPLADLADEIKEKLYASALEERYERWMKEDLRLRHHVEVRP